MDPAIPRAPLPRTAPTSTSASSTANTLADLTAKVQRTIGERPPPLVGCSLTLLGDEIYLFGGRLVPTRTMVSSLYSLDLKTLVWTLHWPPPASSPLLATSHPSGTSTHTTRGPSPRYFHSAEAFGDTKIIFFGGESYQPTLSDPSDATLDSPLPMLSTLDDVFVWDAVKKEWEFPDVTCKEGVEWPVARYAHLSAVQSLEGERKFGFGTDGRKSEENGKRNVMVVVGGQDVKNSYLHEVNVLDLDSWQWVKTGRWEKRIGAYRAVATSAKWSVVPGQTIPPSSTAGATTASGSSVAPSSPTSAASSSKSVEGHTSESFTSAPSDPDPSSSPLPHGLEPLIQLPYSVRPSSSRPEPLLLFSNFNYTQVRRELEVITTPQAPDYSFVVNSLSESLSGASLPPGLRFPSGGVVGRHLIVFGTFLSQALNNFSIWSLDLGEHGAAGVDEKVRRGEKLNWSRVDPGSVMNSGSWNRAIVWNNSIVVLGDRERDIAQDYDHRRTNFSHVAFIDLEAYGIYQPPPQRLPPLAQSFGLFTLSQSSLSDFEIICSDGKRLACSRKLLYERWSWFKNRMDQFKDSAQGILAVQQKRIDAQTETDTDTTQEHTSTLTMRDQSSTISNIQAQSSAKASTELRLTPRSLHLPETSDTVLAFLQYLYSLSLCTSLQLSLHVLTALLVFARNYEEMHLRALVTHALHVGLGKDFSATGVYAAATLGMATALQLRSLKLIMYPRSNQLNLRDTPSEPPRESVDRVPDNASTSSVTPSSPERTARPPPRVSSQPHTHSQSHGRQASPGSSRNAGASNRLLLSIQVDNTSRRGSRASTGDDESTLAPSPTPSPAPSPRTPRNLKSSGQFRAGSSPAGCEEENAALCRSLLNSPPTTMQYFDCEEEPISHPPSSSEFNPPISPVGYFDAVPELLSDEDTGISSFSDSSPAGWSSESYTSPDETEKETPYQISGYLETIIDTELEMSQLSSRYSPPPSPTLASLPFVFNSTGPLNPPSSPPGLTSRPNLRKSMSRDLFSKLKKAKSQILVPRPSTPSQLPSFPTALAGESWRTRAEGMEVLSSSEDHETRYTTKHTYCASSSSFDLASSRGMSFELDTQCTSSSSHSCSDSIGGRGSSTSGSFSNESGFSKSPSSLSLGRSARVGEGRRTALDFLISPPLGAPRTPEKGTQYFHSPRSPPPVPPKDISSSPPPSQPQFVNIPYATPPRTPSASSPSPSAWNHPQIRHLQRLSPSPSPSSSVTSLATDERARSPIALEWMKEDYLDHKGQDSSSRRWTFYKKLRGSRTQQERGLGEREKEKMRAQPALKSKFSQDSLRQ